MTGRIPVQPKIFPANEDGGESVFKRTPRSILILSLVALCVMIVPAVASASTAWVSNTAPVVPGGKSCAQSGFSTIQAAINAGGGTINVCSGTYAEQLTITNAVKLTAINGVGTATVTLPAKIENATTTCETEIPAKYQRNEDAVSICTTGKVSITGLSIEAHWPANTCYDSMYGIFIAGGGTLKATNVSVDGAGASPINGCQGGVGIDVGSARDEPNNPAHATLSKVLVSGYQKNGINIVGAGSTASITGATVTGAGPTNQIAQNGIEVAFGGTAKIKGSTVSGNECEVAVVCGFNGTQAAGLLFFLNGSGSNLTTSKVGGNDFGAYYVSESGAPPSTPELTLTKDVFSGNRYEGVILDQGKALLKSDTINGAGKVGIELLQYEGQAMASNSSATSAKIEGQSDAAIKVFSDKAGGDIAGKFLVSKSTFSGNGTILINESNNFEVIF